MKKNDNPATNNPPEDQTVLARINDPSAQNGSIVEGSASSDPHEQTDDDTVLAHINGPDNGPDKAEDRDAEAKSSGDR